MDSPRVSKATVQLPRLRPRQRWGNLKLCMAFGQGRPCSPGAEGCWPAAERSAPCRGMFSSEPALERGRGRKHDEVNPT